MEIREFLTELQLYFPLSKRFTTEETARFLEGYVNDILYTINEWGAEYYCDYEKLLRALRIKYTYKEYPSISTIVAYLPHAKTLKPVHVSYSGREGQTLKRVINGIEYEFTIVPNHWDKVNTVAELDKDIERKNLEEINA